MNANALMLEKIAAAINSAGKYVSLNLSGSALTTIPDFAYDKSTEKRCALLVAITITGQRYKHLALGFLRLPQPYKRKV